MTIIYDFCNVISSCRLFERYMNKYEHLFTAICGGKKAQSGIIHVYESCFTFPSILGLNCTSSHSHGLSELLIRSMGIHKPPGKFGLYWMPSYKPSVCVWNGEFIIKSERVFASRTRPAAILETVEYQLIWSYKHRWSSSFGCVSFVQTIYCVRINISAYISYQKSQSTCARVSVYVQTRPPRVEFSKSNKYLPQWKQPTNEHPWQLLTFVSMCNDKLYTQTDSVAIFSPFTSAGPCYYVKE